LTVDKVYCADGMHGGVAVLLCGVDEIAKALLDKRSSEPSYKVYLELDGYTFEDWIRNRSPTKERLKLALKEGWAELVNGAYTQPFAENIGLESNIRQLQWGKALAKKAFGADIETYLIQEHAFHVALPQILLQLGFRYVVLRTHWPIWGQHKSYPCQSFYWQGADGSKILTIPHYSFLRFGKVPDDKPHLESWIGRDVNPPEEENVRRWLEEAEKFGIAKPLSTREPDLIMRKVLKDETVKSIGADQRLQFVTPGEYGRMVENSTTIAEFIHPDDMDTTLPFGLRGDRVPIYSKRVENLLLAAEKFSTVAYLLSGRPYCNPNRMNLGGGQHYGDDLWFAWRKLMLAEQHDIWVCGPIAYADYSLEERGIRWLEQAEKVCREILEESMSQILLRIRFSSQFDKAVAIAVFNPLPWSRTDVVTASFKFREGHFRRINVVDSNDNEVPTQVLKVERHKDGSVAEAKVAFAAMNVPGIGYKVHYLIDNEGNASSDLKASDSKVENSKIVVDLDSRGITGIMLKDTQEQLIAKDGAATRLVALQGDKKAWVDTGETPGQLRLVESGPVMARYEIQGSTSAFNFRKTIAVYANLPRVDIEDCVTVTEPAFIGHHTEEPLIKRSESGWWEQRGWHTDVFVEEEKMRSVVPLAIADAVVRRNVVYVPSETRRNTFSGYDWADVSGKSKGMTLINRGNFRYFFDRRRIELSLVLGYSGTFHYSSGSQFHKMSGDYEFRYSLYPHESFKASSVNRATLEANNPLIVQESQHGTQFTKDMAEFERLEELKKMRKQVLPEELSFVSLDASSGNISTILVEDGSPIVRVYEDSGEKVNAQISFFKEVEEAEVLDLRGRPVRRLQANEGAMGFTLNPFEILTIRLKLV